MIQPRRDILYASSRPVNPPPGRTRPCKRCYRLRHVRTENGRKVGPLCQDCLDVLHDLGWTRTKIFSVYDDETGNK